MNYTFASATILLILITDPIGNIPIFANALQHVSPERRPWVILREVMIAFVLPHSTIPSFLMLQQQFWSIQELHMRIPDVTTTVLINTGATHAELFPLYHTDISLSPQWELRVHSHVLSLNHRANPQCKEVTFHKLTPPWGERHCWNYTTLLLRAIKACWTEDTEKLYSKASSCCSYGITRLNKNQCTNRDLDIGYWFQSKTK